MSETATQTADQPEESVTIDVAGGQARNQEPRVGSRFVAAVNRYKDNLRDRPIRYDILSIIFTILIFIGGLVGYINKGSVPSLVSGTIFTILLAFSTYLEGARKNPYPLLITLIALSAIMLWRYIESMNFQPAGLIGLLTVIMLARHCYLLYTRKRSATPVPTQGQEQEQEQRRDDEGSRPSE